MAGNGEIFLDQVREVQNLDMGIITMPQYQEARMSNNEANEVPWDIFRIRMAPFAIVTSDDHNVEFLLCAKNIAWGVADANIFAGQSSRRINEISDLDEEEGRSFFDLNFKLARQQLYDGDSQATQVNIGFNPGDLSIGHHSLLRLHSHVRSTPEAADLNRRKRFRWHEMDKFDRMAFIEPFSPLYHDYLIDRIENIGLFDAYRTGPAELRTGYSTIPLRNASDLANIFEDVKRLYEGMRREYETIHDLYTAGTLDPELDRVIPRPVNERQERLESYLATQTVPYSEVSIRALRYLAEHLSKAKPRDLDNPRDVDSRGTMYVSRGFSGAITFRFERDGAWLDILPRVVTTSGVTKTIMGDKLPTVIAKTHSPAGVEERAITNQYHQRLVCILTSTFTMESLTII